MLRRVAPEDLLELSFSSHSGGGVLMKLAEDLSVAPVPKSVFGRSCSVPIRGKGARKLACAVRKGLPGILWDC